MPLLLPSFTYMGVHQSHHSLSTYGTKQDPEYLPFANSRQFDLHFRHTGVNPDSARCFWCDSSCSLPLVWSGRDFIAGSRRRASAFSMNPDYRRKVTPAMARTMRLLGSSGAVFVVSIALGAIYGGIVPLRTLWLWGGVLTFVSFFNTLRVLGAHAVQTDGSPRDRLGSTQ